MYPENYPQRNTPFRWLLPFRWMAQDPVLFFVSVLLLMAIAFLPYIPFLLMYFILLPTLWVVFAAKHQQKTWAEIRASIRVNGKAFVEVVVLYALLTLSGVILIKLASNTDFYALAYPGPHALLSNAWFRFGDKLPAEFVLTAATFFVLWPATRSLFGNTQVTVMELMDEGLAAFERAPKRVLAVALVVIGAAVTGWSYLLPSIYNSWIAFFMVAGWAMLTIMTVAWSFQCGMSLEY